MENAIRHWSIGSSLNEGDY